MFQLKASKSSYIWLLHIYAYNHTVSILNLTLGSTLDLLRSVDGLYWGADSRVELCTFLRLPDLLLSELRCNLTEVTVCCMVALPFRTRSLKEEVETNREYRNVFAAYFMLPKNICIYKVMIVCFLFSDKSRDSAWNLLPKCYCTYISK